jgi:chemotaxis family two-component system response regulator Rcp1
MDLATVRVLLIEDAEPDILVVRESLAEAGLDFDLQILGDGEKAIEFIAGLDQDRLQPLPDVILLDLNLPRKPGTKVLEWIRRSVRCGAVPVVVVTSSDSPKDRADAQRLGATHYFRKPSSLDDFMKLGPLVRRLVRASENPA